MKKSFSDKLGFDVKQFFQNCFTLLQDYQPKLVTYYTKEGTFPKEAFQLLDKLEAQVPVIYNKLRVNRENFDNYSDFLVFDQIEDFVSIFKTIENYSKWYKSSTIKGRFKQTTEVNFILRQNQTLESFSSEVGWNNREKGALDLALRNQIKETDYDLSGGMVFRFAYQNDKKIELQTVVDEMTGENLLGKDIQSTLEFKNDDLVYLTPADTFLQTCEILTNLMKNSNPEFPDEGFDKSAISNKNIMRVRMSTFIRQMFATVKRDDTIASFSISDVSIDGDALSIEVQYKSYLGGEPVKKAVYGN